MTFITNTHMAEIECELILAKLNRKGYGIHEERGFMRIAPSNIANVDFERLLKLRLDNIFVPGVELEMMERRRELEQWYTEVVGEKLTGTGGRVSHFDILNDTRLWMWLEPTHEDRKYYKYAVINARKWHKTTSRATDIERAHRFAWRTEFWEILKNDCTTAELEAIENDIYDTLESLKGAWSALKFTPKNERKSRRYDELRKQFGTCYNALRMIEEEHFARDKQLQKDRNEHLMHWHPLDDDPIHHERDAYRMRLHHDAAWHEKHHA